MGGEQPRAYENEGEQSERCQQTDSAELEPDVQAILRSDIGARSKKLRKLGYGTTSSACGQPSPMPPVCAAKSATVSALRAAAEDSALGSCRTLGLAACATPKAVTEVVIATTSRPIWFIHFRCSDSNLSASSALAARTTTRGAQKRMGKRESSGILDAAVTGASSRSPRRGRAQSCFAPIVDGLSRLLFRSFLQTMVLGVIGPKTSVVGLGIVVQGHSF